MAIAVHVLKARLSVFLVVSLLAAAFTVLSMLHQEARAGERRGFSSAELIDGFHKSVFGLEFGSYRYGQIVKKFTGPVRLRVVNQAAVDRTGAIAGFLGRLRGAIPGLDIRLVHDDSSANFTVYVVNRSAYMATVRNSVLGTHSGSAPGQCLVRVEPGAKGIRRSTAVIVSDEGEGLFRRCMVEEILQGLGPMNDSASLKYSVFNDSSTYDQFMPFDRMVVSMLYDRRVRHGMSPGEVDRVLPVVLAGMGAR